MSRKTIQPDARGPNETTYGHGGGQAFDDAGAVHPSLVEVPRAA